MGSYDDEGFMTDMPPIPEDEFCVYGTVYCKPEHADELEQIYAAATQRIASGEEPGTIYYTICRDSTDRTKFHFFERYAGKAAFEKHTDQDSMRRIFEVGMFRGVKAVFAKPIGQSPVPASKPA